MSRRATLEGHLRPQNHAALTLVSLIVFALAASRANLHTLTGWESRLFFDIYNLPAGWAPLFLLITQLGSGWMVLILSLVAYAQKMRGLAIKLLFSGLVATLAVEYFKQIVGRPRPAVLLSGITPRDPFVSGNGFPSGHTAIITVLSLTLLPYIPRKYRWLAAPIIILVAFSRIYLGVHAPLDVVGGFCLGLCVVSLQHTFTTTHHRLSNHRLRFDVHRRKA